MKLGRLGLGCMDWNRLFVGLVSVGPFLPIVVACLVIFVGWTLPIYGFLILLGVSVFLFTSLIVRTFKESHRKIIKIVLDAAWNFWALVGIGTLAVSFTGGEKLETLIGYLTRGWGTFIVVTPWMRHKITASSSGFCGLMV